MRPSRLFGPATYRASSRITPITAISIALDFADRGAILDEEQRTLAELRHKRAEEQQRKATEEAAQAEPAKKPRARRKKAAE